MSATGKDHARINLSIWGDDDWLDLTVDEQLLYFALWTSPSLTYCGSGDWHAGRVSNLASDWTIDRVQSAASGLSAALFVVFDTETDEFLIRSWIKHDGLWKTPNMAVSMANARAGLASRALRGVVVHEVQKIRDANPDSSSWAKPAVASLLDQWAVDPADLALFNPGSNPPPNPGSKGKGQPLDFVTSTPTPNPSPTPAPTPTSYSYSNIGNAGIARDDEIPLPEPPPQDYDEPTEITAPAPPKTRATQAEMTRVRTIIGSDHPRDVVQQLALQVRKLGTYDHHVVDEVLQRWANRPGIGPGLLPHLVSDVIKESKGAGQTQSKADIWQSTVVAPAQSVADEQQRRLA